MSYKKDRELRIKLYNMNAALPTLDEKDKSDFQKEIQKVKEELEMLNSKSDHKTDE